MYQMYQQKINNNLTIELKKLLVSINKRNQITSKSIKCELFSFNFKLPIQSYLHVLQQDTRTFVFRETIYLFDSLIDKTIDCYEQSRDLYALKKLKYALKYALKTLKICTKNLNMQQYASKLYQILPNFSQLLQNFNVPE